MIRHIMYMIKTYIIKIQSQNPIHDNRRLTVPKISFKWPRKTKILIRIIQSKMIPIQDQIFWTWTRIGVVCRNIGPLKTTDLRPPPTQIEHFILLVYIFFSYTKWDTNKTQMLQRVFKKQGGLNHKNQVDQNFQTLEEVPKLSYSLDILCLNL